MRISTVRHRAIGQTTAEYAILIGVVVGAIVGMQVYMRRGVNARLKDASDSASDILRSTYQQKFGTDPSGIPEHQFFQYEPEYASSTYTTTQDTKRTAEEKKGVFVTTDLKGETKREAGGQQDIAAPPQ